MIKKITAMLAALAIAAAMLLPVAAEQAPVTVRVDGRSVAAGQTYAEDGVTYVPVRAFAYALDGTSSVVWNASDASARVRADGLEMAVYHARSYIEANDRALWRGADARVVNGVMYAPLTLLARAFGRSVVWNGATRSVSVTGAGRPIVRGEEYYDANELYWLSRIISAEA